MSCFSYCCLLLLEPTSKQLFIKSQNNAITWSRQTVKGLVDFISHFHNIEHVYTLVELRVLIWLQKITNVFLSKVKIICHSSTLNKMSDLFITVKILHQPSLLRHHFQSSNLCGHCYLDYPCDCIHLQDHPVTL